MGRTACTEPQCLYKDALYLGDKVCSRSGGKKWLESHKKRCRWAGNGKDTGHVNTVWRVNSSGISERGAQLGTYSQVSCTVPTSTTLLRLS